MLKGKKVNLRLMREGDLDAYIDLSQDLDERGEFLPLKIDSATAVRNRFHENGFWSEDRGVMVMVEPATDRLLGTVVFFRGVPYMDGFEVGYALFKASDRGKGIVSEALAMWTRYLFLTFKINRLQLAAHPDNAASIRVAEKCGYSREGLMRGMAFNRGRHEDLLIFSFLQNEALT